MTALGHVAVAGATRGMHPVIRLVWGLVSHGIMDRFFPEYRPKSLILTSPKSWLTNWKYLLVQLLGVLVFCLITGDWMALFYGMFADIIEGLYVAYHVAFGDSNVWNKGKLLLPFHRADSALDIPQWTFMFTFKVEMLLVVFGLVVYYDRIEKIYHFLDRSISPFF